MVIMAGSLPEGGPDDVRGVDLRWLQRQTLQLTTAPTWYSLRARMLGELCASCDVGMPEFGCTCPESQPIEVSA